MSFQEYSGSIRSRLHLGHINAKAATGIIAIAVAVISICAYSAISNASDSQEQAKDIQIFDGGETAQVDSGAGEAGGSPVYVHVAGCVKSPGVYALDASSRIGDAVEKAGGFTEKADKNALNLAEKIVDGQQILVPEESAVKESGNASDKAGDAGSDVVEKKTSSASESHPNATVGGLININTATSQELQTLNGVGEAKAAKIIEYRESNGAFGSVDDLTNVSGIGEKTLESIKASICV